MSSVSLAHVGAFSMSNYGDQIYPGVLASLLVQCGFPIPNDYYALTQGTLPGGPDVRLMKRMSERSYDAVLVGGGDLIRTDKRAVAFDHLRVSSERRSPVWARLRAEAWARRNMVSGPGPWLPRNGWGARSALASVGVHPRPDTDAVRRTVSSLAAAWVRTQRGARVLADRGLSGAQIHLGPDAVFGLPLVTKPDEVVARGRQVLARALGLGAGDGVIVFHAAGFTGWTADRLAAIILQCAPASRVVLPLGRYAGEQFLLREAADRAGVPMLDGLDATEITAVLAAAGCVVSTSMHAAIVAASFGRPVVAPGTAKTRTAFEACPEPPPLRLVDDDALARTALDSVAAETVLPSQANVDAVLASVRWVGQILQLDR